MDIFDSIGNNIRDGFASKIADLLLTNTTLTKLDLQRLNIDKESNIWT